MTCLGQLVIILPGLRVPSRFWNSQSNHFPSVSYASCYISSLGWGMWVGSQGHKASSSTADTWRPCGRWQGSSYRTEYWQRHFCPLWRCISSERACRTLPELPVKMRLEERGKKWKARERAKPGKEKNRWLIAGRWELWLWWIFTVQRPNDFRNGFFLTVLSACGIVFQEIKYIKAQSLRA